MVRVSKKGNIAHSPYESPVLQLLSDYTLQTDDDDEHAKEIERQKQEERKKAEHRR